MSHTAEKRGEKVRGNERKSNWERVFAPLNIEHKLKSDSASKPLCLTQPKSVMLPKESRGDM